MHTNSELVEVDPDARRVIANHGDDDKRAIDYDLMHVVPPQSAPDWVKASPLADPANLAGYVEVDKHTMRHVRYPNIFALGDAGSTPNSKTGAAIRKQAPVVVTNLRAGLSGCEPTALTELALRPARRSSSPHLPVPRLGEQPDAQQQVDHHPRGQGPYPGLDRAGLSQHGVDHLERHDPGQLAQMTRGEPAACDRDDPTRVMTEWADSGAPGAEDVL